MSTIHFAPVVGMGGQDPMSVWVPELPESLFEALYRAHHVVVFTGAGVSAESGIPTFRDTPGSLWGEVDPRDFATREAFRRDPALVWGWYEARRRQVMLAQPNPAHRAISDLARCVKQLTVVTQNIDDLHERAGCVDVLHLHGSFFAPRCVACARPHYFAPGLPEIDMTGLAGRDELRQEPPRCARCNGRIRPGVVWFGENLPEDIFRSAERAVETCDVLFSIGTSSVVYPAALLPLKAVALRRTVIQVNPGETDLDVLADFNLRGRAGDVMPRLLETVWPDLLDKHSGESIVI